MESSHIVKTEQFKQAFAQADVDYRLLVLTKGILANGKPFYAYCRMKPTRYEAFLQAQEQGNYNLKDYGEIITSGFEEEPPSTVQDEMAQTYGFNPQYMQELVEEVEKRLPEQDN